MSVIFESREDGWKKRSLQKKKKKNHHHHLDAVPIIVDQNWNLKYLPF